MIVVDIALFAKCLGSSISELVIWTLDQYYARFFAQQIQDLFYGFVKKPQIFRQGFTEQCDFMRCAPPSCVVERERDVRTPLLSSNGFLREVQTLIMR